MLNETFSVIFKHRGSAKVFFLIFWFQKIILKRSRIQLRSPCFFTLLSHNEFLAWRHSCRPQIHQKYNRVIHKYITWTLRKNIVHCWKKRRQRWWPKNQVFSDPFFSFLTKTKSLSFLVYSVSFVLKLVHCDWHKRDSTLLQRHKYATDE